jgi:hypothetical protein
MAKTRSNVTAQEARSLERGVIGPLGAGCGAVVRGAKKAVGTLAKNPKPGVRTPIHQPEKVRPLYPPSPLEGVRRAAGAVGRKVSALAAAGLPAEAARAVRGKATPQSTGMGKQSGGRIRFESQPRKGGPKR